MQRPSHSWFYRNSLSVVTGVCFLLLVGAQIYFGWKSHLQERIYLHAPAIGLGEYLGSGHFVSALFENWESEFLQMGVYVWLTVKFRQIGSAESRPLNAEDDPAAATLPAEKLPRWARPPFARWVYAHSLALVFMLLFVMAFVLHALGGWQHANLEHYYRHEAPESFIAFLGSEELWFESMQNWQSEFLSVFCIVVFTIYFRQINSPQSKKLTDGRWKTGD